MAKMENVNVGRSTNNATGSDVYTIVKKIMKDCTGTEYENVIKVVKTYWSGADADDFIKDFKSTVSTIKSNLNNLNTEYSRLMSDDRAGFQKFQATNVK